MRGLLAIIFACGFALSFYFFLLEPNPDTGAADTSTTIDPMTTDEVRPVTVVGTTPQHAVVIASLPQVIAVRAREPLTEAATLTVSRDGQAVEGLQRNFTSDRMTMEVQLSADAPSGVYTVLYQTCRAAGLCEPGGFAFRVR